MHLRCFCLLLLLAPLTSAQIVEGTVVNADTGAPIPGARVKLDPGTRNASLDPLYARTGANGAFQFVKPPLALYTLRVEAPGYLPPVCCTNVDLTPRGALGAVAGGVRTGPPPPAVTRTTDAKGTLRASVRFPLTAYAVITGQVTDPTGLPLANAEVEILQKRPGGQSELVHQARAYADDRGRFRAAHLAPGTYYVVAKHPQGLAGPGSWEPADQPTYYPAAIDPAKARPLELSAGAHAQADIRILRRPQ